jgi:hypothetical protein
MGLMKEIMKDVDLDATKLADQISDARNLMNAAWLCRLEDPSRHADFSERVLKLWQDYKTARLRAADSTGPAGARSQKTVGRR